MTRPAIKGKLLLNFLLVGMIPMVAAEKEAFAAVSDLRTIVIV